MKYRFKSTFIKYRSCYRVLFKEDNTGVEMSANLNHFYLMLQLFVLAIEKETVAMPVIIVPMS